MAMLNRQDPLTPAGLIYLMLNIIQWFQAVRITFDNRLLSKIINLVI